MLDVRRAKSPDKFISINLDADNQVRVANVENYFGRLPARLCLLL